MSELGIDTSDVKKLFSEMDTNKGKLVNFDEFANYFISINFDFGLFSGVSTSRRVIQP